MRYFLDLELTTEILDRNKEILDTFANSNRYEIDVEDKTITDNSINYTDIENNFYKTVGSASENFTDDAGFLRFSITANGIGLLKYIETEDYKKYVPELTNKINQSLNSMGKYEVSVDNGESVVVELSDLLQDLRNVF